MDIQVNIPTLVPNEPIQGQDKKFSYKIYRYPLDLGSTGSNHYIVFHINQQAKTKYKSQTTGNATSYAKDRQQIRNLTGSSDIAAALNLGVSALTATFSSIVEKLKVDSMLGSAGAMIDKNTPEGVKQFAADYVNPGASELGSAVGTLAKNVSDINFVRTVEQTTETIALYMPDTLNFQYNQQYDTATPGGSQLAALAAGGASLADTINKTKGMATADRTRAVVRNLSPFIANYALKQLGDFGRVLFAAGTGVAQNPMLEVLYSSPQLRSFRFDFMFWPKSQDEAKQAQEIIDLFRFHQAPEILPNSGGFFLVPPSEFDIKFYYSGKENPNIPRISTCVLENIDIDYAPNGFSAYEVVGNDQPTIGGTGMPVGIRMSLQFKETIVLTKAFFRPNESYAEFVRNQGI